MHSGEYPLVRPTPQGESAGEVFFLEKALGKFLDLTGLKFGRLTAIERVSNRGRSTMWRCSCECGNETTVVATDLRSSHSRSCGCIKRTCLGMNKSPEYKAWKGMIERCTLKSRKDFHVYGGRGISVCQEWRDSFVSFLAYIGPRPENTSLDRIDVDQGYCPGNVRWATAKMQARNRRSNVFDDLDVAAIKALIRDGVRQTDLAKMFETSDAQICKIANGYIWDGVAPAW